MLAASDLFDLRGFAHRDLFDRVEHVWEALDRLPGYLSSLDPAVLGRVAPGAVIHGPVFIGRGTVVEPCAMIVGPAFIGEGCEIRHGAYIRGIVLIGDRCIVGHCSELKSSILLDEAKAPHFNYVGDSILGNRVNLGAGTVCANLRLDGLDVSIRDNGARIATGRQKLGAILGDDVRTGCNVALDPGTIAPKGTVILPPHHANRTSRTGQTDLSSPR
jgi:NDP-sugar pyrophosphorylase family protein